MSNETHANPSYFKIWLWLVILLIISVAAVYLPFSQTLTVSFIFLVAAVKTWMVAVYFMHLKSEGQLVRYIAVVPVVLFIIMTLTLIPDTVYNR